MKTQRMVIYLVSLIACSLITWQAESTLFAVLAYIALVVLLGGLGKNLVNKFDG